MKKITFILVLSLFTSFSFTSLFSQSQTESLRLEAQKQMQFGRYGEAIDLLNRYISALPQEALGYNLRGLCYEKRKDYENAVYDYKSALKLEPNNNDISTNLSRATTAWYSLLYNKIEGHKRELAINPDKAINYLEIGKSYKNLGQWETSEEWYDKYLAREEASADEIIRYSEILAKDEHIAKGEPILKKYTEKYPNDHRLWSRYGYFSLWLGKRKIAIDAFEHALALRPYFKEAQDGLDRAKGNGYIYAINDTSIKYIKGRGPVRRVFEYPIDRDYRLLKKDPNNNALRFKLVKELVSAKRYEEATQLLDILSKDTTSDAQEYVQYYSDLKNDLKKIYKEKIAEYTALVKKNPANKKAAMTLAEYYEKNHDYDKGMEVLDNYLSKTSSQKDNDVKYLYARLASKNKDFPKALLVMDEVVKSEPNNYSYNLFYAQLMVWQGKNLDDAKSVLQGMLVKDPKDIEAIITLASLSIQQRDFKASRNYINKIRNIDSSNPNLEQLESDFEIGKIAANEARLFDILQQGRQLSYENKCQEALVKYDEYLAQTKPNIIVQREYADVNVCAKNYEKAIDIYNDLLSQKYDYDTDMMRAKTYYYMRDSIDAVSSFQRLVKNKPVDFEANLYLSDSYIMMEEYSDAADVINNMRNTLKLDSSQVALVDLRESWLPKSGFGSGTTSLFSYATISPYGAYYGDNLGFRLNSQGLRLDLGVTSFMMFGVEGYRTALSNDSVNQNINNFKLNLLLRIAKNTSLGAGFGTSKYENNGQRTIANVFIKSEEAELYSAVLSFNREDAAQILYSPNLVDTREYANVARFNGYYVYNNNFKLAADLNYLSITDGNNGHRINLRLGKYFFPEVLVGYEYENMNYLFATNKYYSPQNYASHSLFGDFNVYKSDNKLSLITIGGKIGLITNSSFVIRQLYASFNWNIVQSLTLQGNLAYGSTYQTTVSYSSFATYFGLYWNL